MSQVTEQVMGLGQFTIDFKADIPPSVIRRLDYMEHLIITASRVDERLIGDQLLYPADTLYPLESLWPVEFGALNSALYTGVITRLPSRDRFAAEGAGLAWWLGDHEEKGEVIETAQHFVASSFEDAIRALAPTSVPAGNVYTVAGDAYTADHIYESPRTAIDRVCEWFDAEWLVTPRCVLQAGTIQDLYGANPTAVVVPTGAGSDPSWESTGIAALGYDGDIEDYSTRVLMLAASDGDHFATATADLPTATPYRDLHGNIAVRTRIVQQAETSAGYAALRATRQLNRFKERRREITLSLDRYDAEGDWSVGHRVYVWDPTVGLIDNNNEIHYRGRTLNPVTVRVHEATWPLTPPMGVYHRTKAGVVDDLTDYIEWSSGPASVVVGAGLRTYRRIDRERQALRARVV